MSANRDLNSHERDILEDMVDSSNLFAVLSALSIICDEKAEHIETNWQDQSLARLWQEASGLIGVAAASLNPNFPR